MTTKKKKKVGRPSAFRKEYAAQAEKLCVLGATDAQMADFFAVSTVTINAWKKKYPAFLNALKVGKEQSDNLVTKSLFQRANGYEHAEDKIFNHNGVPLIVPTVKYYAPDTTACIFWLKNRQPDLWRDTHDIRGSLHQTIEHRSVSETDSRIEELFGNGKDQHPAPPLSH